MTYGDLVDGKICNHVSTKVTQIIFQ